MYVRSQSGLSGYRGLGDALVSSLASAIRQVEGYNPNFAANNNPGNLVYVGQAGAVPGAGGFAKFASPEAGEAALEWQIQNYIDRGYNLTQFFNTYAPGGTSNAAGGVQTQQATNSYVNTVASNLGLDPSIPLNSVQGAYAGPGSFDSSNTTASAPDSSSSFDLSSFLPSLPSSDSQFNLGGLVLSGSDLLLLGAVVAGVLVVSAII